MGNPKNTTPVPRLAARIGTLRRLEILLRVAESGGIVSAAEQLHLTQPSASTHLRKLAEGIDMPLYELVGRRIKLTEAGEQVVVAAREIFGSLERLEMRLSELQGMQAGRLSLAVASSANAFIPHLLGPFCKRYPGIEVDLQVGNRDQLLERLDHNLDDLYFVSDPPDDTRLEAVPLISNPLVVIASREHPLARKRKLRWSDIANERFVVREVGSGTRHTVNQFLADHGLALREQMTIASNEALKHAVMAGLGLAIVSGHILDQGDREDLAILPVEGFPLPQFWYLVNAKERVTSVLARTFRDFLLGEGLEILKDGMSYWEKHHRPKLPKQPPLVSQ
ncbi:LysR family transcriptional regulator [Litorivivens sp.]|uniref:LysR family transcriptional regulator n=1 Tax=Litorivivens sp. TaxID=2020868 RepID=UPI00356AA41E